MDLQKMASPQAKKSRPQSAPLDQNQNHPGKSLQQMSPKEYRLCTSAERKAFEPGATVFFGWLGANPDLKKKKHKKQCSKTAAWAHENWWFELLLILYPKCERNISWLFPPYWRCKWGWAMVFALMWPLPKYLAEKMEVQTDFASMIVTLCWLQYKR